MYLESVDSTNSYLKNSSNNKPEEGLLVYTKEQLAGRGQRENHWESETNKNLLLSFIVYPVFLKADEQFILSKFVSLAMFDFLSQFIDNVYIKWPNDIYINNKKIAGVLIENTIKGKLISSSVIGIGININQEHFRKDIPNPISLKMITQKTYDIHELLHLFIDKLNNWYNKLLSGEIKKIDKLYLGSLFRYNEIHNFMVNDKKIRAKIIGIDENGRLMIEMENGSIEVFAFKEIKYCI